VRAWPWPPKPAALGPRPLQPELDQLHAEVADVKRGVDDLKVYAADSASSIRRVLGAVSTEVTDCPCLFTLSGAMPAGMQRLRFFERQYRLVLWCEHPGFWNPWPPATYSLRQPKDWLIRVGPYVKLIVTALQLIAPIAGPVAGIAMTGKHVKGIKGELEAMSTLEHVQSEVELMTTLISDLHLPKTVEDRRYEESFADPTFWRPLTVAQGEALRGIRSVILEHDHMRAFGDLRRVQSPSGDFQWVCPVHYVDYDPGLPRIP